MRIENTSTFKMVLRNGPYAWPGGYPLYFIDDDGDTYCFKCIHADRRDHIRRLRPRNEDERVMFWKVAAIEVNWEDTSLECYDCGAHIQSAYGDDVELDALTEEADDGIQK